MSERWPDIAAGNAWHSFISILCSNLTLHSTPPCCCCCCSSQLSTSCCTIGALISWRSIGLGGSTHMSIEPRIVSNLRQACVSATSEQLTALEINHRCHTRCWWQRSAILNGWNSEGRLFRKSVFTAVICDRIRVSIKCNSGLSKIAVP